MLEVGSSSLHKSNHQAGIDDNVQVSGVPGKFPVSQCFVHGQITTLGLQLARWPMPGRKTDLLRALNGCFPEMLLEYHGMAASLAGEHRDKL